MKITILTIFPEMFAPLHQSILGRAQKAGLLEIREVDIRAYSKNKHHNTDDAPYGGGAGMVMLAQPIVDAVRDVQGEDFCGRRIYLSPRGQTLTQRKAEELAREKELILLCGHYEGVDQRALDLCIDEEISIGDYVLTGGELPALVLTDAVARMCEGVLPDAVCFEEESHYNGLLEYPQYTRPEVWHEQAVPPVLLSGHHKNIETWRFAASLQETREKRPDLYAKYVDKK
ncbi:MAG: tRNA (guanosine(37)-N1)-methyltransferase TrmD [Ruminococcus sp.]|nr:tRNA (guanosine(37)-N1)-methyltransferase TrmD [Ruminococcus sp.]